MSDNGSELNGGNGNKPESTFSAYDNSKYTSMFTEIYNEQKNGRTDDMPSDTLVPKPGERRAAPLPARTPSQSQSNRTTDRRKFASGERLQPSEQNTPAPIAKVSRNTMPDREKQEKGQKRIDTISIVLIAATIVLFVSAMVSLFLSKGGAEPEKALPTAPAGQQEQQETSQTVSPAVKPESPFRFDQTYSVTFPGEFQPRFANLYQQNKDFVGWLRIPDTCIDFPVYQTDNNSYYLKHDNFDNYTKYGTLFLDSYDDIAAVSRNMVIYGHHFEDNNLIFAQLENYSDIDFYKARPVIEFDTLHKDMKWKVFAAFRSNGNSDGDNGYLFYYVAADMNDSSFAKFYDEVMQRSYLKTSVDLRSDDKILTLSTCTYFFDRNGGVQNARYVVMARLVRPGESEAVDTSGAYVTDDVRYPQLYYDVYGGSNPWRNASKWYPEQ